MFSRQENYFTAILDDFSPKGEKTPLKPFELLVRTHDLAQVDLVETNLFEQQKDLIPNRMHYIFIINPIQSIHLDTIERFKTLNPEYATILWIDKQVYSAENLQSLISWGRENNIHLLDVQETLQHKMGSIEPIYNCEVFRKNPGSASDILRLVLLSNFGGIYSDIDILCKEPIGEIRDQRGVQINIGRNQLCKGHPLEQDKTSLSPTDKICNDLILARPNMPFINGLIDHIADNYFNSAVLYTDGSPSHFISKPHAITAYHLKMEWTKKYTGPTILKNFYFKADVYQQPSKTTIAKYFVFGSTLSWFKSTPAEPSQEEELVARLKRLILIDLYYSPKVLRFANYKFVTNSSHILDQALEQIVLEHPEAFKEVKFFHSIEKYQYATRNDESIKLVQLEGVLPGYVLWLNKAVFPKLDLANLLEQYFFTHRLINTQNDVDNFFILFKEYWKTAELSYDVKRMIGKIFLHAAQDNRRSIYKNIIALNIPYLPENILILTFLPEGQFDNLIMAIELYDSIYPRLTSRILSALRDMYEKGEYRHAIENAFPIILTILEDKSTYEIPQELRTLPNHTALGHTKQQGAAPQIALNPHSFYRKNESDGNFIELGDIEMGSDNEEEEEEESPNCISQ